MTIVIPDLRVRVFGIRHHGPGSARSVRQGLEEFSPDVVLIEGPSDADPLVMLAASDSMKPPIALLAYATGEPSKAAASVLIERLQRATGRIPADRDR